jgi:hypothetical protein
VTLKQRVTHQQRAIHSNTEGGSQNKKGGDSVLFAASMHDAWVVAMESQDDVMAFAIK